MPEDPLPRPATSIDVAKLANVSRTTVSYVMNGIIGKNVSKPTRDRVLAAADTLGYTPNAAARALRAGRNQLVLALVPDWDMGPTFAAGMKALNRLLTSRGFILVIHSHSDSPRSLSGLWSEVRPAVVMVFGTLKVEHSNVLRAAGITAVDARMSDYLTGLSRLQAEHLWALGHRTLGYLRPAHYVPRDIVGFRIAGAREFCTDHGLDPLREANLDYNPGSVTALEGDWFTGASQVTGVIAHTDELAAFIRSASTIPFTPTGTALIGTGDRPIASIGLTTVGFDFDEVALFWAENALAALEGRTAELTDVYPGWIVVRETA